MSMYLWYFFPQITIFVYFNKTFFRFLLPCFPQENPFISVDTVDNSVYKSIYKQFYLFCMWISCEHIKKWLLHPKKDTPLFCALFLTRAQGFLHHGSVQSSRRMTFSPTRAPGTRQLLLTYFLWTTVCIKKTGRPDLIPRLSNNINFRKSFSLIRHFDMSHWKQWSLSLMCWRERSVHCQHKDPHDQNSTQYLPAVHCWVPRHHIPGFSKLMKNAEGLHQNYCTHSWQNQSSPYRL